MSKVPESVLSCGEKINECFAFCDDRVVSRFSVTFVLSADQRKEISSWFSEVRSFGYGGCK
jgi:hypothetical protein